MMKRRRGRAKSLPDSTRRRDPSYSPIPGMRRRAKRSETSKPLSGDASRLSTTDGLHMTTRHAASRAATNSSSGSIASADSRRSSLANATHLVGGDDIDSRRPSKRARRTSTTTTENRLSTRRRQTLSQDPSDGSANTASGKPLTPEPPRIEEPEDADPIDDPIANGLYGGFASENEEKLSPLPKRRGRRPKPKPVSGSASRIQSLTAGWDQENGTDREASNAPSRATSRAPSRPPSRVAKRMPGRRRAPHADPSIEADLRRQLQLRLGYRSVAKALKPLLAELSQRSIDALEDEEDAHQEGEEYVAVMAELNARLHNRLEVLKNERRIKTDYRLEHLELAKDELRLRFQDRVEVLRDDFETRAENRLLELYREYEREMDADATEEEDGVVGAQHGKTSKANPTGWLDHRFDSRSRFFLQTEKLADSRQKRIEMRKQQRKSLKDDEDENDLYSEPEVLGEDEYPAGYGMISTVRREYATSVLNMHTLAQALETVEKQVKPEKPRPKVLLNEDATSLQALADMAMQPPIVPPARVQTPPVVVKQELLPVGIIGQDLRNSIDLTTPPRHAMSKHQAYQLAEQNSHVDLTSPQKPVKAEENNHSHAERSPTTKKHQRTQSQLSSGPSPRMQESAIAAQPIQIPGLGLLVELPQPSQYSPRMQPIPSVPNWDTSPAKVAQNGERPTTSSELRESSLAADRDLPEVRPAQPIAAETTRPDHANRDTPPTSTTSELAPTSRWLNLYEQTHQRSDRIDAENGRRYEPPTSVTNSRRLSETARPTDNERSNLIQANTSSHRRNISIPARVSSPVSFLRRSQSPLMPESGRRGILGHTSPLTTDLPATYRTGSPSSGSQSAIEPLQRKRGDHPPPGSWQGPHHRHSQSARTFSPPLPQPQRQATPGPYPPGTASSYQTQPPYTTVPPYHPPQPQPQGPYTGPYTGPPPSAPQSGSFQGPPHHFQPPPQSSAPQYEQRASNPFLPAHPSYPGPAYQTSPQGYYYDGGPPPSQGAYGPRFAQYPPPPGVQPPLGQLLPSSGQPSTYGEQAGPPRTEPPPYQGNHGRSESWSQGRR